MSECRFKLTRSEALIDVEETQDVDGELKPALRVEIIPEVPVWPDQKPDVIYIFTNKHGLKSIKLNGDFIFNGATKYTVSYLEFMARCYIEDYLLNNDALEKADVLNRYLALLMIDAHKKIFAINNIVNGLAKPPRLLRLITFIKYVKLRLSIALFNIKSRILKGKGMGLDPRVTYETYLAKWIEAHRE